MIVGFSHYVEASAVDSTAQRATKEFGVNSTPTFFVNGEKHTGALTLDQFDKILAPLLGSKP